MVAVKKVLIADDVHPLLNEGLMEAGWELSYQPLITRAGILQQIGEYGGLVIRTKTNVDQEILEKGRNLFFVARAGAGLDNVDEDYARQKNVLCFNAGEANADAVAEHATGMLLMLLNKLGKADREVRSRIWKREENRGFELKGQTVGIIGYGNTGRALARKLQGFEVKVLAYDKYLRNYGDAYAREADLNVIFEESDILSLHIPLSAETRHLINEAFIGRFRKDITLLNLSRGQIVKTDDVVKCLQSGKLRGVALDVLENENLSALSAAEKTWFDYLAGSDQSVLSPHIAGWTFESYRKISEVLLKKILELRAKDI